MKENETGKLWPGMIQVVNSKYQGLFKGLRSEPFETYREAEDWIIRQKERKSNGYYSFSGSLGDRQDY